MRLGLFIALYTLVAAGLAAIGSRPTAAAEPGTVVVHLQGGATFAGELAAETDAAALWLETSRGSARVLRPLAWDALEQVSVAGRDFSPEQLYRVVDEIRRRVPQPAVASPRILTLRGSAPTVQVPEVRPIARPVRHLALSAEVGGWTDSVEVDGLVVEIRPVDERGRLVPVRGTLEVDLTGQVLGVSPPPQPFFLMGRWTEEVSPEDFADGAAVYRLPFQAVHPEFALKVDRRGAVHARLSVPGQGTFEATQSSVRIRPASIVRDDLQRLEGHRFFPQERTRDGRR